MQYKEVPFPPSFHQQIRDPKSPMEVANRTFICWRSTMVVPLTCNQMVGGSSPFASSIKKYRALWVLLSYKSQIYRSLKFWSAVPPLPRSKNSYLETRLCCRKTASDGQWQQPRKRAIWSLNVGLWWAQRHQNKINAVGPSQSWFLFPLNTVGMRKPKTKARFNTPLGDKVRRLPK